MTEPAADRVDDVAVWVADVTGGRVERVVPMGGGGRPGFGVDVEVDGERRELYLQQGRSEGLASFLPIAREAEVMRALEPLGIPVAHVWAVDGGSGRILVDRARGTTWFRPPADPAEQELVAKDFVRHLAAWHQAGAAGLELPSFEPVKTIREDQVHQTGRYTPDVRGRGCRRADRRPGPAGARVAGVETSR